jgi:Flp pilus assembly protein TadG
MFGRGKVAASKLRREQGNSLVEVALILPMFLLLALGALDLGLGFRTYIGLTNAAREGARWLSTHPDDPNGALARVAVEAARVDVAGGEITTTITPDRASYDAGDVITVEIEHDYALMFSAVTNIPEVPFVVRATMVVLYD